MTSHRLGHRLGRVTELLQRTLANYFLRSRARDPRIDDVPLTISGVEVSADLQHAKIYVQVLGEETVPEEVMESLRENAYRIKRDISRELGLRYTPQLEFSTDAAFERGQRVSSILSSLHHTPPSETL